MNHQGLPGRWLAVCLLLALSLGAASPFTLRFGASGNINTISMVPDPTEPDAVLALYQIGCNAEALVGYDTWPLPWPDPLPSGHDVMTPVYLPGPGRALLYFSILDPLYPSVTGLSQDFRPLANSQVWQMNLIGMAPGYSVTLTWQLLDGGLEGRPLRLQDKTSGEVLVSDMTVTSSVVLTDTDQHLLIIYGAANHPPVAHDDTASMLRSEASLQIPFADLLANDYDIDAGDTIAVVGVDGPSLERGTTPSTDYGTIVVGTGVVTYTVPASLPLTWKGTVYLHYTIRDNHSMTPLETSATVEVTVAERIMAAPSPAQVQVHPGTAVALTYILTYSETLHSLAFEITPPAVGVAPNLTYWAYQGGSYSDDAATADPTVGAGAGVDGNVGTADDTVVFAFGTNVPPSGTAFAFLLDVPADAVSADVVSSAIYRVSGDETEPSVQRMPVASVRTVFSVSFTSAGNGTIAGQLLQQLEPGMPSSAVQALPASHYRFLRWLREDVEIGRDERLTVVGGSADMAIVAEFERADYLVTLDWVGPGSLDGVTTQFVSVGGSTTAVEAVADTGAFFRQWSDGSTVNPRILSGVAADITLTAEFGTLAEPVGAFDPIFRDQSNPSLRSLWDVTGPYETTVGPDTLSLHLVHDEKGRLTGTGGFRGSVGGVDFDLTDMPFKGTVKGTGGVMTVKGSMSGSSTSLTHTTKVALRLTLTQSGVTLTGLVTGSVIDSAGGKRKVSAPCTVQLPPDMLGTFQLHLHLLMNARGAVTSDSGQASSLTLVNGRTVKLLAVGRLGKNGITQLRLSGDSTVDLAFTPITFKINIRTYTDDTASPAADIVSLSAAAFGQNLKWPR